mgnify:CR=1 FL=1
MIGHDDPEYARVEAGVTIEQRLAPVPTVTCDPGQIAQVLMLFRTLPMVSARAADRRLTSCVGWSIPGVRLEVCDLTDETAVQGIHAPELTLIVDEAGGIGRIIGKAMARAREERYPTLQLPLT